MKVTKSYLRSLIKEALEMEAGPRKKTVSKKTTIAVDPGELPNLKNAITGKISGEMTDEENNKYYEVSSDTIYNAATLAAKHFKDSKENKILYQLTSPDKTDYIAYRIDEDGQRIFSYAPGTNKKQYSMFTRSNV